MTDDISLDYNMSMLNQAGRRIVVELLSVEGCPNAAEALRIVTDALVETGLRADIHITEVQTPTQARELEFLGSPTVRVNGRDVEPGAGSCCFGLTCRIYRRGGAVSGVPSREQILAALEFCD